MYPREFDYVAPASLDEALAVLNEDAKVMSGGMSLIPMMKLRLFSPSVVVDIGRIPGLDGVKDNGDHISLGALVRHGQTATNETIQANARALADAASLTGDVQVRNRGTTCGALAHADVAADQPGAALALGATMMAHSASGVREIPASEFFVDALTSALNHDEILTAVSLPKSGPGEGSAYDKLGRRGGRSDYAIAGAAAWIKVADGNVVDARVALTGVGTRPTLAASAAAALVGTDGSEPAIVHAAGKAADDSSIIEDLYGTEEYKRHLSQVFVARAFRQALANAT